MGKLETFEINYDHPYGVYRAGEVVKGQVFVHLTEPMKMTHIELWVIGKGNVHWIQEDYESDSHFQNEDIYFDTSVLLAGGESGTITLEADKHTFDFAIPLSDNLPSSFEGSWGFVRYMCRATIKKPWKHNHEVKTAFTIISNLDLNNEPEEIKMPIQDTHTIEARHFLGLCCSSGKVTATFGINRRAFVPGECVLVNCIIQNNSGAEVSSIRASIKQYTDFYGEREVIVLIPSKTRTDYYYVTSENIGSVKPHKTQKWDNIAIEIPALPPSRLDGCDIINISYFIEFIAKIKNSEDIKMNFDLTIGTVPLYEAVSEFFPEKAKLAEGSEPVVVPGDSKGLEAAAPSSIPPTSPLALCPPAYEQCTKVKANLREKGDSQFIRGNLEWAPTFPVYRSLSSKRRKDKPVVNG